MPNRENLHIVGAYFRKMEAGLTKMRPDMDYWFKISCNSSLLEEIVCAGDLLEHCGTTGCIAGTTIAILRPDVLLAMRGDRQGDYFNFSIEHDKRDDQDFAGNLLGLSNSESHVLFFESNWNVSWRRKYHDNKAGTLAEICERIAAGEDILVFLDQEYDDE